MKEVDEEEKEIKALDEKDIALLKSYGQGQYTKALKVSRGVNRVHCNTEKSFKLAFQAVETDIVEISKRVNELAGIKVPIHNNMPTQNASKAEQRISFEGVRHWTRPSCLVGSCS